MVVNLPVQEELQQVLFNLCVVVNPPFNPVLTWTCQHLLGNTNWLTAPPQFDYCLQHLSLKWKETNPACLHSNAYRHFVSYHHTFSQWIQPSIPQTASLYHGWNYSFTTQQITDGNWFRFQMSSTWVRYFIKELKPAARYLFLSSYK
jgi:hypothetical protein